MKISEDIKSISYVKRHTNDVFEQIKRTGRPVIITQNGEPTAVLLDVKSFERHQETRALLEIITTGVEEIKLGKVHSQSDVIASAKKRLVQARKQ